MGGLKIASDYVAYDGIEMVMDSYGVMHESGRGIVERDRSLAEMSEEIGKNKNYFNEIKANNSKQYRRLYMLGRGDMAEGYRKLESFKKKSVGNLRHIRKMLKKRDETSAFYNTYPDAKLLLTKQTYVINRPTMKTLMQVRRVERLFARWWK